MQFKNWHLIPAVIFGYFLILVTPFHLLFTPFTTKENARHLAHYFHGALVILFTVMVIVRKGLEDAASIRPLHIRSAWYLILPFIFPISLSISSFMKVDDYGRFDLSMLIAIISYLIMGVSEEIAFRGLLQGYIKTKWEGKRSMLSIVLITSALFALMHIMNLRRYSWVDVTNQVVGAFYFGVFFGAMVTRVQNIWILGIIHGLINISFSIDNIYGIESAGTTITTTSEIIKVILTYALVMSPMCIMGIIILRRWEKKEAGRKLRVADEGSIVRQQTTMETTGW